MTKADQTWKFVLLKQWYHCAKMGIFYQNFRIVWCKPHTIRVNHMPLTWPLMWPPGVIHAYRLSFTMFICRWKLARLQFLNVFRAAALSLPLSGGKAKVWMNTKLFFFSIILTSINNFSIFYISFFLCVNFLKFIHPSIHPSSIHPSIHPSILHLSFIHVFIYSWIQSIIHVFIYSCIHVFVHSINLVFIYSIYH